MISECTSELSDIEQIIQSLPTLAKQKSYLTKYALIKASGTLEMVYRSIIADYFTGFHSPQLENFLDAKVRHGSSSAKYEMMSKLLKMFDESWSDCFKKNVSMRSDSDKIIVSSNSLVRNRHDFAHGQEPTATFNEIKQYYLDTLELIKELDLVVNGD